LKTFEFQKIANMIMLVDENNQVWKAWDLREFTDRKMKNAMKRIEKNYQKVEFIKKF